MKAFEKQFGKRRDVLGYLRGKKGILFTCPQGKEKDSRREALNVLSSIIEDDDHVDDKKIESEKKSDGTTAADELAAELRAMRDSVKKEKFEAINIGIQGTVFIIMNDEKCDPDEIVASIFREMARTKKSLFRLCTRLYPISITSKASLESIQESCKDYISKALSSKRDVTKFRIVYRKSLNTEIRRLEVIKSIASFVDSKHTVDMKAPDVTIIVMVMKNLCTVALSSNHHRYCEYSIAKFLREFKISA